MYLPMMYIILYIFISFEVFVNVLGALNGSLKLSSVPLVYPRKDWVVVDAQTDLTLGCRGAEPLTWSFFQNDHIQRIIFSKITNMYNDNDAEYKFETILTVPNVSYGDVGFYYCHGESVDFDAPRRSGRIYVFVHDEINLSVITKQGYLVDYRRWFMSFPCKPTAPNINVTLTCDDNRNMTVNPSNYSSMHHVEGDKIRFDPIYGFTIHVALTTGIMWKCDCSFQRNDKQFSLKFETDWGKTIGVIYIYPPIIQGPDTVNVGDTLKLQCIFVVEQYFPYDNYRLQWNLNDIPINKNKIRTRFQRIKLKNYVLLINTLTMKNVSIADEGNYGCNSTDFLVFLNWDKYVFINDPQPNNTSPRITHSYDPNQDSIQLNSDDNLTINCEGSQPITWSFSKQENRIHNMEHFLNIKTGLYESHLYLTKVQYEDIGFYYCHENGSTNENPFKSNKIYVFVTDGQHLYVQEERRYGQFNPYSNITVPCLPTSRDIFVSLFIIYQFYNYSIDSYEGPATWINPKIYGYDPREGFNIQIPDLSPITPVCSYVTNTSQSTQFLNSYSTIDYGYHKAEPFINDPYDGIVFIGQILELTCTVAVYHNVSSDMLTWTIPNKLSSTDLTQELKSINVFGGKVLISKLTLNNVKYIDEGRYICSLSYNNATALKYISVYDKFDVAPFIENLKYDYAYIGLQIFLRCTVNVDHNIEFKMAWTVPNVTAYKEKNMKTLDTEYIRKIQHVQGQSIIEIDNVTLGHEGKYSCNVLDLRRRRKYVTKNVLVKRGKMPKIITSNFENQGEIDIELNERVKMNCSAEGDPKPVIIWKKGPMEIRRLGQHIDLSADNSELTINFVQSIDEGLYTCIAQNPFGQYSRAVNLYVKTVLLNGPLIAALIFVSLLIIATVAIYVARSYTQKKFRNELMELEIINFKSADMKNVTPFLHHLTEQTSLLHYNSWEIPRNKIELGRNLGSGCFGLVVQATVSNYFVEEPVKTVAIKMLHSNSGLMDLKSLISEFKIMADTGKHVNLINLLGACTEQIGKRKLLVVIEYCKHGSLRNYLIENRCNFINFINPKMELICVPPNYNDLFQDSVDVEQKRITTLDLLSWGFQVARGMEFLAAKRILHGDLAARNILLAENNVVKISDFGLSKNLSSKDYYRKKSQCPLPVKWMAIEAIREKTFSIKSDVWSFGVVLWELFSLARTPYPEMEADFQFFRKLDSGYRLGQPKYSTKEIYQVMLECWETRPERRPTFFCLVRTLGDLMPEDMRQHLSTLDHHYENINTEMPAEHLAANVPGPYYQNVAASSDIENPGYDVITWKSEWTATMQHQIPTGIHDHLKNTNTN